MVLLAVLEACVVVGVGGRVDEVRVAADEAEPEALDRLCRCCPVLTYQQRMLGFVITFALGGLLSLSALSSIGSIFLGNPAPFAFKYTFEIGRAHV